MDGLVLASPQASVRIRDEEALRRGRPGFGQKDSKEDLNHGFGSLLSSWEPQAIPGLTVVGIASFCPFQAESLRKETESDHPITWG